MLKQVDTLGRREFTIEVRRKYFVVLAAAILPSHYRISP